MSEVIKLKEHIHYNALLFVFPAAIVVSNAYAILVNGVQVFEVLVILALMYFVWIEFETSVLWLRLEPRSPTDDVSKSQIKLSLLMLVDFCRIFSLSILYLAIIYGSTNTEYLIVGRVQADLDNLILLTSSIFLMLNGLWNIIVKPDHKDVKQAIYGAFKKTMASSAEEVDAIDGQLTRNSIVLFGFKFFVIVFYVLLPVFGFFVFLYFIHQQLKYSIVSVNVSLTILIVLVIESILKTVQFGVLSWTLHNGNNDGLFKVDDDTDGLISQDESASR